MKTIYKLRKKAMKSLYALSLSNSKSNKDRFYNSIEGLRNKGVSFRFGTLEDLQTGNPRLLHQRHGHA